MRSIRRDLLVSLLAAVVTLVALTALATYRIAREEANELFDYHLRQLALSLSDQSFAGGALPRNDEDFDFVIQVWSKDGIRIYFSHPHSAIPDQARLGFATVRTREGAWRVFSTRRGSKTVQVAQPMSVRDRLAFSATLRTLLPFLALLPVLAALKELDLGASAIDDEVVVNADAEALRSLLSNLIENAIRYTPRGGTIDIAIGAAAGLPFLEVADSGPGIPEQERERVFDRFYRREETAESGTGLGLAIVKAVVQRHGARVTLGDSRLGGLSVRVEFPAAANARAA